MVGAGGLVRVGGLTCKTIAAAAAGVLMPVGEGSTAVGQWLLVSPGNGARPPPATTEERPARRGSEMARSTESSGV